MDKAMNPQQLVDQYNTIFRNKPTKWASNGRNAFAFNHLSQYGEPKRMLDVGCGNGHTIQYFSAPWKHTEFWGVDLSDEAIRLAKERVPQAHFVRGFICAFPEEHPEVKDFDLVTLLGVIEHFSNPRTGLEKIATLLSPKGRVYIEAPNCLAASPDQGEGFRVLANGSGQWEWHYKRETWEGIFTRSGYKIVANIKGPGQLTEFVWVLERNGQK